MSNSGFKQGRLGIGKDPIFPLDVNGHTRIDGDLVLHGTIADSSGNPIKFGNAGILSKPRQEIDSNTGYYVGINYSNTTEFGNYALSINGDLNLKGSASRIKIDGEDAIFSNWKNPGKTNNSFIYRSSKLAVGLNSIITEPANGDPYFNDLSNVALDISGDVNIRSNGNLLFNGVKIETNPTIQPKQKITGMGFIKRNIELKNRITSTNTSGNNSNIPEGTYDNITPNSTNKSGSNVEFTIVVDSNKIITSIQATSSGIGYDNDEILTFTDIHANQNLNLTLLIKSDDLIHIGPDWGDNDPVQKIDSDVIITGVINKDTGIANKYLKVNDDGNAMEWKEVIIPTNDGKWSDATTDDIHYSTENGNGNVGIGTNTPSDRLHLYKEDADTYLTIQNKRKITTNVYKSGIKFKGSTSGGGSTVMEASRIESGWLPSENGWEHSWIKFQTHADKTETLTDDLVIKGGKIGIGTASPNTKLHIRNDTATTGTGDAFIPSLSSNSDDSKPTECLRLQGGSTGKCGVGALIRFTNFYSNASNPSTDEYNLAGIAGYDVKGDWGGGLCFYTAPDTDNGGDLTTRMVIDDVGNVGIGTTSPNYLGSNEPTPNSTNFPYLKKPGTGGTAPIKLDVRGSIELSSEDPANPETGAYAPNIYFPASNGDHVSGLIWRNYHTWTNGRDIRGGILFEPKKGGYGYASGGLGFYTSYYYEDDPTNTSGDFDEANEVTATCKMTIRGNGNVGIGTESPACGLQVGAESESSLKSSVKMARFQGFGYREFFPSGAYVGLSSDNHSTFCIGLNTHINKDNKIKVTNTHEKTAGTAICMPGNDQPNQGGMYFFTKNPTSVDAGEVAYDISNSVPSMMINGSGNVGIGTRSPITKLDIRRSGGARLRLENSDGNYDVQNQAIEFCTTYDTTGFIHQKGEDLRIGVTGGDSTIRFYTNNFSGYPIATDNNVAQTGSFFNSTHTEANDIPKMIIDNNGNVIIGISSSSGKLTVYGQSSGGFTGQAYTTSGLGSSISTTSTLGIYSNGDLGVVGVIRVGSDGRIKQNIEDVPDNLALEMVRNIPCRYYEYIDKINRDNDKTIGFIAQEVKEHFPMAVTIHKDILPNEMRKLEISWEEIIDDSNNTYKLISDLSDCSGVKYRFYVSNDPSGNDEVMKEVVGNPDNTFIFEKKWNNVFCYGKEVDDFHMLDKQKLFALNFSATQELDKKVKSLENESQMLKNENQLLKEKIEAIEKRLAYLGF